MISRGHLCPAEKQQHEKSPAEAVARLWNNPAFVENHERYISEHSWGNSIEHIEWRHFLMIIACLGLDWYNLKFLTMDLIWNNMVVRLMTFS